MNSEKDAERPAKRWKAANVHEIFNERNEDKSINNVSTDLIEIQKNRAIAQWEQAFSRKHFDEKTYRSVLMQLQDGKVPPIYHTLCRDPEKRLFLPNALVINKERTHNCLTKGSSSEEEKSDVIELSSDPVQAGICTSVKSAKKEIRRTGVKDVAYLDAFFTKEGHASFEVYDGYLGSEWFFHEETTKIVTDLVNTPADMVGHDVEVTELHSETEVDGLHGRNLITRSLSRGVIADCFEHSDWCSTYAIAGLQGIGKSWSLIYALQQALLYENACVLFFFQKVGEAWTCIRKSNQIYVWNMHSPSTEQSSGSSLFDNENVLVLLDPKESHTHGASYIEGRRRLIFAASNNLMQRCKGIEKITPNYERILNPYTMEELQVALKYMSYREHSFTNEEIALMLERAKEVGNVPRSILSSDASDVFKRRLNSLLFSSNYLSIKNVMNYHCDSEVLSRGAFTLCAFGSISDDNYAVVPHDVGYDGDSNVDYGVRKIIFTSDYVTREVAMAFRHHIMHYEVHCYNDKPAVTFELVKAMFWFDMEKNITMAFLKLSTCLNAEDNVSRMDDNEQSEMDDIEESEMDGNEQSEMDGKEGSEMDGKEGSEMDGKEGSEMDGNEESEMDGNEESEMDGNEESEMDGNEESGVDGNEESEMDSNEESGIDFLFAEANDLGFQPSIQELEEAFFNKTTENIKCRMKKGCKLFHFAGPGRQLFHVTVRRNVPSMDFAVMKQLLIASGILKVDGNGALYKSMEDVPAAKKLMFYWVVPMSAYEDWRKRKAQTLSSPLEEDKDEEIVKECFNDFVDQFVVFMR